MTESERESVPRPQVARRAQSARPQSPDDDRSGIPVGKSRLDARSLSALQRTAGNSAVGTMLATAPGTGTEPAAPASASGETEAPAAPTSDGPRPAVGASPGAPGDPDSPAGDTPDGPQPAPAGTQPDSEPATAVPPPGNRTRSTPAPLAPAVTDPKAGAGAANPKPAAPAARGDRPSPRAAGAAAAGPMRSLRAATAEQQAPPAAPAARAPARDAATIAADPAPPTSAVPAASFTDVDLPASSDARSPGDRRRTEQAAHELATDRVRSQGAVDSFVAERQARSGELAAMRPELGQTITGSETTAIASIDSAARDQIAALRAAIRANGTRLRTQAQQARGKVTADHTAATGAIRAATRTAREAMGTASTTARESAGTLQTGQLTQLGGLYTRAEGQFRTAASTAGALAVSEAATRAQAYRSHKIHQEDDIWDGYLTDNRCEAQAEAAEKVGGGYRDELVAAGEEQITGLRTRRPTDEAAIRQAAEESRTSLTNVLTSAGDALSAAETEALRNADSAKASVLATIDETLRTTQTALARHEAAQVAQIQRQAAAQIDAVRLAASEAVTALGQAIDQAITDVDTGLVGFVAQLSASPPPDPELLDATLADTAGQLDGQLEQLRGGLRDQSTVAAQSVADAATEATTAITQTGEQSRSTAGDTTDAAVQAIGNAKTEAGNGLRRIADGHKEVAGNSKTGHDTAVKSVLDGLSASYDRLNSNFTAGAAQQATAVSEGLTNAVRADMPGVITTEAQKARDQVQPRWKSVLKWIIIIAIVLVVALVLGPLVIGAVTGAAAALGASAGAASLIGMVVGGALVGAATSAATTVIDNGFAGRDLTTGLGMAIAMGALGGALGGAASGLLAGPMQGMTALTRYGIQVGVDVVIDSGINLATGNLTWENFGTGLLMSAFVNGVTAHPRAQSFQHGMSSRGYGAGFGAGSRVHSAVTGRGTPVPGAFGIDSPHINSGDTAGPNSPYRGTWDMGGGGHNATEIRPRAAAEGMTNTPVARDPITGVAIDRFGRQALDSSGNPIPDATAPGGFKLKSTDKSIFPESMTAPQIEAAAQGALARAIAGAPHTTHTPPGTHPNGKPKNGTFSAIVVTPEGHPIRVEGYYGQSAGGGMEIKTVYPATDLPGGTIPPVPGSRVSVPGGVVTPPDYEYGD